MKKLKIMVCGAAIAALISVPSALGDGTETLGAPSVTIASGTDVVVAGVGMNAFPNTANSFTVAVPAGATVKQVLLYWQGHWTNHTNPSFPVVAGDDTITVNGNSVTGTSIGGPTAFFTQSAGPVDGTEMFQTYRADITGLGLVGAGTSTLTISNMLFASNFPTGFPFNQGNDGVGVLVIYDDGSSSTVVGVRDGQDLAFQNFAAPLDTTVPQTFTFASATTDRSATLATLAGSVKGPDVPGVRGNVITGQFNTGQTFSIVNGLQSNQGFEFDAANFPITVPAGATSLTVQALSQGGDLPASLTWINATLSIDVPPPPPPPGDEGCTPGFWKNHPEAWPATGFTTSQLLSSVFAPAGLNGLGSKTLLQALDFGGGNTLTEKKQNLLRIGVAAVLSAAHPGVNFPMTTAEVIAAINAALASNNKDTIEALKNDLDELLNAGCPL
jgi:hypothetical protein